MKILHLISSGGMYGAEAVILNLMRVLRGGPHESALGVFLGASQAGKQLYERALAEGLETHGIPCSGPLDRCVPRVICELANHTRADIVHAHGYKADVYLYLAMRRMPTPLVSTCHTWYDNDLSLRLYGALDRFVLRRFARVAAVSGQVRARLLASGVPGHRVVLIRNGIDLRNFEQSFARPAPDHALRVGLVGRLDREKGIDLFLRAAVEVLKQLPLTRFEVVGDGPDRDKLQALIHEFGIEHNVFLPGRRDDMAAFYSSIDLLVSSSRQEGLPIALLEAMASSLPIVATAVGAVPDVLRDGESGLLVNAEDVPALTAAMLALLHDAPQRARLGAAARLVVAQRFSADRMAADYLDFYEQALQESHRAPNIRTAG